LTASSGSMGPCALPSRCIPSRRTGLQKRFYLQPNRFSDAPPRPVLLLLAPALENGTLDPAPWKSLVRHLQQDPPLLGDVTRIAFRGYPAFLLADDLAWKAIENDAVANLALSSEEEALLHKASRGNLQPVFINGRAGSGKSTMLYYLFADYCHRKLLAGDSLEGEPIFLCYSERPLEVARDSVARLLESQARFLAERGRASAVELKSLTGWFRGFRDLLLFPGQGGEHSASGAS
jgi:hypothetical protein